MQSKIYDIHSLASFGGGARTMADSRRPDVFSYLFFMGLIASTFFI